METAAPAPPPPPISPALAYADSLDSSPRSRNTDSWDDPSLPSLSSAPSAKLRWMCSYGGHIVPRPHDKSLCYLGGDTRIVVVDRSSLSLSSLSSKLSSTLLDGRPFSLKYQLPNEDLDSLISVTTDEDLDNMIDEYDRTMAASAHKPSRLRLFLFPSKPDSPASIGSLLDDSKSETWFVDALNGAGVLPRGLSAASADSADVNCLLGLDDSGGNGSGGGGGAASDAKTHPPDSPMLETASSSFGSTSSAHFLSNLPPIRVHVDEAGVRTQEPKAGLEEQFNQMNVGAAAVASGAATGAPLMNISPSNENPNRGFSDDERVEQGVPVTNRKPPQPPQPQQQHQLQQQKQTASDVPPDTVTRDNSNIPGVISRPKPMFYQDPVAVRDRAAVTTTISSVPDPKREVSNPNYRVPIQVQDPSYVLPPMQPEQQQFVHATPHYIHHHATGPVPISSYYQMHPMHQQQSLQQQHQQQQQQQAQQQQQHRIDQQYPMYFMPVGQNQPYNLALPSNLADGSSITSSKPAPLANPAIIPPSYKESTPVYAARSAPPPKPELTANLFRTAAAGAPQPLPTAAAPLVHMGDQQQYMGYHQMHHPSQSAAAAANFAYEYGDQLHAQIYYTQAPPATLAPQYQTVSSGAMISEAAMLSPPAATAEAKQNRTSQPL